MKKDLRTLFYTCAVMMLTSSICHAGNIGEVDTVFKMLGPDHKIKVISIEDPDVKGVACFLSRPVTGGLMGAVGLASDKSDVSISCRQTGPIEVVAKISDDKKGQEVFNEKRSVFFKELHVTRFYDKTTQSFVYLTYSDKLIDGSPKSSISVVTPQEVIDGRAVLGQQFIPR